MNKRKSTSLHLIAQIATPIALWCWFFFVQDGHIHLKEQINLFNSDFSFWSKFFSRPASIAEIAGAWLTQFFLYPAVGAVIYTLLIILLFYGLRKHTSITSASAVCIAEAALCCHIEYPVSMTVALVVVVWIFNATRKFKGVEIFLYPLFGVHSLIYAALLVGDSIKTKRFKATTALSVAIIAAMPFLVHNLYNLTARQAYIYPLLDGYSLKPTFIYLVVEAMLMISYIPYMGYIAAAAALVWGAIFSFKPSDDYCYRMSTMVYYGQWDKILEKAPLNDKYHRYIPTTCYNIALAKKNLLGEDLLKYYQPAYWGLFQKVDAGIGYINILFSIDPLLACCDYSQAQHSLLLSLCGTPYQRSSRVARRLVETAIATDNYALAEKFAKQLKGSIPHRKWAETTLQQLEKLHAEAPEEVYPCNDTTDRLFAANEWIKACRLAAERDYSNTIVVDYLLCFHLLNKDLDSFKSDYEEYYLKRRPYTAPQKIYKQAIAMIVAQSVNPEEDFLKYHLDIDTWNDCVAYSNAFTTGLDCRKWKGSYWYYFNFAELEERK